MSWERVGGVQEMKTAETTRIEFTSEQIEKYVKALADEDRKDDSAVILEDLMDHLKFGKATPEHKLPCPFCATEGQGNITDEGYESDYWCECHLCGAQGPVSDSPHQAVGYWNNRGGMPHEGDNQ